jgi:hypothetical protein
LGSQAGGFLWRFSYCNGSISGAFLFIRKLSFPSYLPPMKQLLFVFCMVATLTTCAQSFCGRTTGQLPYLNYGLGEDRLGGAKMGYLDSNILVKVVDSVKTIINCSFRNSILLTCPKLLL